MIDILNYGAINLAMAIGYRTGLFDIMDEFDSPQTIDKISQAAGLNQRYVTEWLEQQVTTGILTVDDPHASHEERRYSLPASHAEVLVDRDSLNYLTPFIRLVTAAGIQMPALVEVYRNGGGVSWEQYGPDMRTGQAEMQTQADALSQYLHSSSWNFSFDNLNCKRNGIVSIVIQKFV